VNHHHLTLSDLSRCAMRDALTLGLMQRVVGQVAAFIRLALNVIPFHALAAFAQACTLRLRTIKWRLTPTGVFLKCNGCRVPAGATQFPHEPGFLILRDC